MDSSTHANKFVQQLKYFEIFFSSEKSIRNLNENFFKNFSTILRLTDSLYCKIKDDEKYETKLFLQCLLFCQPVIILEQQNVLLN